MWRVTHLKRPWCWERLKAGGEGDDRGWDGWMASSTQWTWVWVNSRTWWWTGRPGVLYFMGSPRVWHDWATSLLHLASSLSHSCFRFCRRLAYISFLFSPHVVYLYWFVEMLCIIWILIHVVFTYVSIYVFSKLSLLFEFCSWYFVIEIYLKFNIVNFIGKVMGCWGPLMDWNLVVLSQQ